MTKKDLIKDLRRLLEGKVKNIVDLRVREFIEMNSKNLDVLFKELCFCILTANFNAEKSIRIQREIDDGFLTYSEERLSRELRRLGHRYPNVRARYIVEARSHLEDLSKVLASNDARSIREWLVKNIKGLGYKEASHFLRNIGFLDVAIIDYHIVDVLVKYNVIDRPKRLNRAKYLEIENMLRDIALEVGLKLGELDLYLWYMETGKVLK
jgi:N-glycosylase/DNA lyase